MARTQNYRTVYVLAGMLCAGFFLLCLRLVDLQVLRHERLSEETDDRVKRRVLLEPRRGDILDARGNLLATSLFVKTVCADPTLIGNHQHEVAAAIAPILDLDKAELAQMLMPRVFTNDKGLLATNRYVVLKRKVLPETWQQVSLAMSNLTFGVDETKLSTSELTFYSYLRRSSVFTDRLDDQLRVYPDKRLASHVLGFVGMSEGQIDGKRIIQTSGKEGIELSFNSKLSGVRGWRLTGVNKRGEEVVRQREQDVEPVDGLNVVLTIDSAIQHIVESELAKGFEKHTPESISAIVVRPETGEILALAVLPNFDPNLPGDSKTEHRRNRAITDIVEPGSTFKIVPISAALNEGLAKLTDVYDTENGHFRYGGKILHDDHPHKLLTVNEIITKSSNIGTAKLALKLGPDRFYEYIRDFGFGQRTSIPLRGESPGILHPVKNWSKISIVQLPMGHGLAVTPIQMAMAFSAIANDGWLMRPMLVNRLEDKDGNVVAQYTPQRLRRVIGDKASKDIVHALRSVTTAEGTGQRAALEHYTVAGKTGTAQKVENGTYVHGKYVSSFIGFFPADNPEVCISVIFDNPNPKTGYYGGTVAGPVFKAIAERTASYLNVRPDKLEAPGPVTGTETAIKTASATRP